MIRKATFLAASLAFCSPIDALSAAEPMADLAVRGFGDLIGSWSLSGAWEVELRGSKGGASTCIAISPLSGAGQEHFRFALYFGDRSGVALVNDRAIDDLKKIGVEMANSGFDLNAIEIESRDGLYRYFNSLSRSMTTKVISSFYGTDFVAIDANGPYLLFLSDQVAATREAMKKCEDFRMGRILPD